MVLVHGPYRRRGLATRLMERSLAELRDRGLVPFLDATPAGRPVYERMGFRAVEALTRWRGQGGGREAHDLPPTRRRRRDRRARPRRVRRRPVGRSRRPARPARRAVAGAIPAATASAWRGAGRTATYVGPLVARETGTALRLLESALAEISGPVLIDVPDRQAEVDGLLAERGFGPERPSRGWRSTSDTGFGDPALVRAIAGAGARVARGAVDALARDPGGRARGVPRRRCHPGPPARARREPAARRAPAAGADPLLPRCRRGRPRGRRPHDAVRDPRGRALPSPCSSSPRRRQPPGRAVRSS